MPLSCFEFSAHHNLTTMPGLIDRCYLCTGHRVGVFSPSTVAKAQNLEAMRSVVTLAELHVRSSKCAALRISIFDDVPPSSSGPDCRRSATILTPGNAVAVTVRST